MAISNMLDLLRDYEKNQDELAFKKALESRFAVTGFSDVMLELTYHPNDLDLWISAVEYEDIDQAIATASQYIESYRNNSGLDYALSILQLIKGRHKAFGIKERLRSAFNAASALPEGADSIINFALKRIKNTSLECREILAEALLETHPEKAQYIQDELEDRVSLAYLLNGILLRMKNYERSL